MTEEMRNKLAIDPAKNAEKLIAEQSDNITTPVLPAVFCAGDEVIFETLHSAYGKCKVVRTTRTQAILDNGERLPITGVDGCRHLTTYRNRHMVHYQTYYRLPNDKVLQRAQAKKYCL